MHCRKRPEGVVTLAINGKEYKVEGDVGADTSLNTFLREHANLRGTKSMCHEGGCGACIVSVTSKHPVTRQLVHYAVNSCMVSVLSCHGWEITTVEGLGDKQGYHPIQSRLANMHGTQCGYCSPGMVMNMHSLMEDNDNLTMKEVENSFGGNICRCTGYRPILDAFKSLAKDADPVLLAKCQDIEDLDKMKDCPKTGKPCSGLCSSPIAKELQVSTTDAVWHKVDTVKGIINILGKIGSKPYMLVAGNTAQGVYRITTPAEVYIDVSDVAELKQHSVNSMLSLGANVTLTETMCYLTEAAKLPQFAYATELVKHIDLIANVPVRNIGTLAGNLSIKHQYREFPSDIFLILETVGAKIRILDTNGHRTSVSPTTFLDLDMKRKLIVSIALPPLTEHHVLKTYKIMPRAQNAHAYVNAGFMVKFNSSKTAIENATVVFGGINPDLIHASATERCLLGMNLFDPAVLKSALNTLNTELNPDWVLPDASPEYRKNLAISLFYKFVLHSCPTNLTSSLYRSGGEILTRELSSGQQTYDTNKNVWPLNKPVRKIEGIQQCSGEAQYVNDIPSIPGELFAAFVLARRPLANIVGFDASAALKLAGVKAFYSAKDIPGNNSFIPTSLFMVSENEEVFCSKQVLYYGQPAGVVVAETRQIAHKAAKLVTIQYEETGLKPLCGILDVLNSGDTKRVNQQAEQKATEKGSDVVHVISGSLNMGSQYHYTMETQSCVCVPTEDGLDVFPASQWLDAVHVAAQEMLNLPQNRINVHIRRIGGGYGGKITRATQISQACALAAYLLNKPVRMVMSLEDNMDAIGKRNSCYCKYEVGVNEDGKIQYLKNEFYQDYGASVNEPIAYFTHGSVANCYDNKSWDVTASYIITDTPSNTWCRSPGHTEAIAMTETIIEHIAHVTGADPISVRLQNLAEDSNTFKGLFKDFRESTDFDQRKTQVDEFNAANRWRKRGIAMVPMKYPFAYWGNFAALVSIYKNDGTVAVSHAGIECGQGINTKVAQVCAHILGIPLEDVSIKPSNTLTAPNAIVTGGSLASEACCYAVMTACRTLLQRLEPIKAKMENATWIELVQQAYKEDIDLCATYMFTAKDDVKPYNIWGLSACEVEVDILTGNIQLLRVDILEDTGESLSPEIDVGQVEGAFVMGLGYWLTEQLMYDKETGALLTNRTWTYKPPGVKDIPVDFRVHFLHNATNPVGVLRSKATGEPSLCMSIVVVFAIRYALNSARADAGNGGDWIELGAPTTAEHIFMNAANNYKQFTL